MDTHSAAMMGELQDAVACLSSEPAASRAGRQHAEQVALKLSAKVSVESERAALSGVRPPLPGRHAASHTYAGQPAQRCSSR